MAITLAQAEAKLTAYLAAEEAILTGQSYRLDVAGNSTMVTRADLGMVQKGIALWEGRVARLTRGTNIKTMQLVPYP